MAGALGKISTCGLDENLKQNYMQATWRQSFTRLDRRRADSLVLDLQSAEQIYLSAPPKYHHQSNNYCRVVTLHDVAVILRGNVGCAAGARLHCGGGLLLLVLLLLHGVRHAPALRLR